MERSIFPCIANPKDRNCVTDCPSYKAIQNYVGGRATEQNLPEVIVVDQIRYSTDKALAEDFRYDLRKGLEEIGVTCLYSDIPAIENP